MTEMIECPKCKSMQISETMRGGYNYLYCENCRSLLDYEGNVVNKKALDKEREI